MPRRHLRAAAVAVLVVCTALSALPAYGQTRSPNSPTSGELVESPKKYDETWVTFTGEAIGEAMVRGDRAWIHLNDDAYYLENVEEGAELGGYNSGQAVWLPADLVRGIEYFGDYKHEGDVVRVTGVFNAACAEHGGDMDIHATTLEVVRGGRPVTDPIHGWKIGLAFGLTLLAGLLFAALRLIAVRGPIARR